DGLDGLEGSISSAITLDPTASYAMVGVQSNLCVGPVGGSNASNVQLEIETCTGTANQRWRPQSMGGGFFRWRNELNGLCIDVSGAQTTDGAAVIQFTCGTQVNQQWAATVVPGGSEVPTARHRGKVLDVTARGTTPGTVLEQFTSNNGTNQHFFVSEALPAIIVHPR